MGTKAKQIVESNLTELLKDLNAAFADEWLAYYQYWLGAKLARGTEAPLVAKELEEHASEELDHATRLADRILILGGTPLLHPSEWLEHTSCGYSSPKNPNVIALLKQNIKGEQCAIAIYNKLLKKLKDKDEVTYHLILDILEDEIEHEDDLQKLLEDLE
jgi:bacterioferritin